MKNIELKKLGLEEMDQIECINTSAGTPWIWFVAGAIAGGLIYDAWKAGVKEYLYACYNGTMDPPIRPSR